MNRRRSPGMMDALKLAGALFVLVLVSAWGEGKPLAVGHIGITVSDLDRAVDFYTRVLDFEKVDETEFHRESFDHLTGVFGARVRIANLKLGDETVQLTEYLTPAGRPVPADSRSQDLWFQHIAIVVRDMDAAYQRLRDHRVKPISTEPQTIPDWNQAAAGIRAFYFRDPDNHALELIYFPPGKGDPRWQQEPESLFLGIDHTAIAVSDTEASLSFYRDLLGLDVAGESLNYGIEQEHLNHVFGSRVHITGLRAPSGPGIEFLEYLAPRDGRPRPADAGQNDILSWQTAILVEDINSLFGELVDNRTPLVSSDIVSVDGLAREDSRAIVVRDPDGHAVELIQP
jgi:catechol 2,3-dioxygenase-like lactoylglutathione lyase family enzyme